MMDKFKNGTVFGDTKRPHEQIKSFYPNAKFKPICSAGFYYGVYDGDNNDKAIAFYLYLTNKDVIPIEARKEAKAFGQYFKLKWAD